MYAGSTRIPRGLAFYPNRTIGRILVNASNDFPTVRSLGLSKKESYSVLLVQRHANRRHNLPDEMHERSLREERRNLVA